MSITHPWFSPVTPKANTPDPHLFLTGKYKRVSRHFSIPRKPSFLHHDKHVFPQAENDILGDPITEEEFRGGRALEITVPEDDPISKSGYFQGDIVVESRDHLMQILEVSV